MHYLTISIRTKASVGKLHTNKAGIYLAYFDGHDDMGAFIRMCTHRKVDLPIIARRPCTEEEYKQEAHPHRIGFASVYDDWDKLIEDEKEYCTDLSWLKTLEELKVKYPAFDQGLNIKST